METRAEWYIQPVKDRGTAEVTFVAGLLLGLPARKPGATSVEATLNRSRLPITRGTKWPHGKTLEVPVCGLCRGVSREASEQCWSKQTPALQPCRRYPIPATPMISSQLNIIFDRQASTQGLLIGQPQTPGWSFTVSTYQFLLKQNMNYWWTGAPKTRHPQEKVKVCDRAISPSSICLLSIWHMTHAIYTYAIQQCDRTDFNLRASI